MEYAESTTCFSLGKTKYAAAQRKQRLTMQYLEFQYTIIEAFVDQANSKERQASILVTKFTALTKAVALGLSEPEVSVSPCFAYYLM